MMDEYIPSPRQTPNKPRRMRDVSALYPVDEKKLLLEAVLKRQQDRVTEATRGRVPRADTPAGDASLAQPRLSWRESQGCTNCPWGSPKKSSGSVSSGSDDYDGDDSDEISVQDDRPVDDSLTSDSDDDNEEEDSEEEDDDEEDSGDESEDGLDEKTTVDVGVPVLDENGRLDENTPSLPVPVAVAECMDLPQERAAFFTPGKLLYGRHCLWYQSAGFVRPHGTT